MKTIVQASASADAAVSSSLVKDATVATSGVIGEKRAVRASNDSGQDAAISAVDAMAICMANSAIGG